MRGSAWRGRLLLEAAPDLSLRQAKGIVLDTYMQKITLDGREELFRHAGSKFKFAYDTYIRW